MKTVNAVDEEPTHEDMMSNVEPYQTVSIAFVIGT